MEYHSFLPALLLHGDTVCILYGVHKL